MSRGITVAPWYPIPATGQSVSLTTATDGHFTNAMGKYTVAFKLALSPAATPYVAHVTVTNAGTAASATEGYPVTSNTDLAPIACRPGDIVHVYQASGSTQTAYLQELTN